MMLFSNLPNMAGLRSQPQRPAFTGLPWPWAALISLVLATQLALIWTHVPWADELQATALARESHTLSDWYWNFRYEGHAPLWHLLLKIPLAFTDDPTALKIVQSLAVLCSAALLHLRAPFSPGAKFLLSLNYFLFFEYGVIARDYSLTVLFFFGALAFRRQPVAWLCIALLPQGGLQSVMLAGICGLIVLREQGWKWWGVLVAACGVVVALVWMRPAEDFESLNTLRLAPPLFNRLARAVYLTGVSFLPVDMDLQLTGWETSRAALLISAAGLAGPYVAIRSIARKSGLCAVLTALFISANFILAITFYTIGSRHFSLWVVLAVGLLWTYQKRGEPLQGEARLWLLILALCGVGAAVKVLSAPFSSALQSAEALREADGMEKLVIPANVLLGAEINGILRIPTYDMAGGCLQSFVRWRKPIFMPPKWEDFTPQHVLEEEARQGLEAMKQVAARAGGHALLLLDATVGAKLSSLDDPALGFLRFIGKNSNYDEWRYLYRLNVPPGPDPAPISPCIR